MSSGCCGCWQGLWKCCFHSTRVRDSEADINHDHSLARHRENCEVIRRHAQMSEWPESSILAYETSGCQSSSSEAAEKEQLRPRKAQMARHVPLNGFGEEQLIDNENFAG